MTIDELAKVTKAINPSPSISGITYYNGDLTLYLQSPDISAPLTTQLTETLKEYGFLTWENKTAFLALDNWHRLIAAYVQSRHDHPQCKAQAPLHLGAIRRAIDLINTEQKPRPMIRQLFNGWETATYKAHCQTSQLAGELTRNPGNVCTIEEALTQARPHCLRVLKTHRTPETQEFRNEVAQAMRARRRAERTSNR
jgi:hypothetical protein